MTLPSAVAILFEASPGFQRSLHDSGGIQGLGKTVAILFEASPGFQPSKSRDSQLPGRECVAILFEASPGFQRI